MTRVPALLARVAALPPVAAARRLYARAPRRRRLAGLWSAAMILAAATLVRWPVAVPAYHPRFRASTLTEVHTQLPGTVVQVFVREGQRVRRGDSLLQLDPAAVSLARAALGDESWREQQEGAAAQGLGDAAGEQLHYTQSAALMQERAVLDTEIAALTVRAPDGGVVLTSDPGALVGARLAAGARVLTLGRTDTLTLEFEIAQRDVGRVDTGQVVRLRVDGDLGAGPPVEGRITSLGELPAGDPPGGRVRFPARAAVPNPGRRLAPGLALHASVLTGRASFAYHALRGPERWLRLLLWRWRP